MECNNYNYKEHISNEEKEEKEEEYLVELLFKKNFINIEQCNLDEDKELIKLCDGSLEVYNKIMSKYKVGTKLINLFEFYHFNNKIDGNSNNSTTNTSINTSNYTSTFTNTPTKTSINISRFYYLRNLCLIEPVKFKVCVNISSFEKILQFCSFKDFDSAEMVFRKELGFFVEEIEVIGATAFNKIGQEIMINVVKINNVDKINTLNNVNNGNNVDKINTLNNVNTQSINDSGIKSINDVKVEYTDEDYTSVEFNTFKYDDTTMLYLYFYAIKILFYEENENMKKSNIEAICKMAFFQSKFNSNFNFQYFFEYLFTSEVNKMHKLKFYIDNQYIKHKEDRSIIDNKEDCSYIDNINLFNSPLFQVSQVQYALALYKMKTFYYGEAYDILKLYNFKSERIQCLIASRKFILAEIEIKNYIKSILTNNNPYTVYTNANEGLVDDNNNEGLVDSNECFKDNNEDFDILNINLDNFDLDKSQKMKLSHLYLKLGHIKENVDFYNKSYKIYRDYPPLRAKAMNLYSKGLFSETVEVLYEAVNKIVPKNVEANYYLGCSLIELERWGEALKIFKELKYNEPRDINISKNLSLCYFMVEDTKNSLLSLKLVARNDIKMTRMYLKLALQAKLKEEIKWVLKFIFYDKKVEGCVLYSLRNEILTVEELRECLMANIHVDNEAIENILSQ